MLLHELLEQNLDERASKLALVASGRRVTYAELDAEANRFAHALLDAGVARGDRVLLQLENGLEAVVAIFGTLKAGAAFVAVHPSTKPDRLAYLLRDCEPSVLVTDAGRGEAAAAEIAAATSLKAVVWAGDGAPPSTAAGVSIPWASLAARPSESPAVPVIDVDLATLIYTSGSTGEPKGVVEPHRSVVAATTSINGYLRNTSEDVILDVLPLAFDYGLYQVFLAFQAGATLVLEKGFTYPAELFDTLEREGVTGLPGVPTIFAVILKFPSLLQRPLPRLRYLTNTAAALPVSHVERLRDAFPAVQLFSMYGLTECKRVSYLPPTELGRRPASVGIAIPNPEVYVVDDDGRRLPPGEVGELVVRGAHVMSGYWRAPERTALRYRPGPIPGERVLYSGDLFRMDADGFLYFVARKDDIIKSRGEKVSPREIENVVCRIDGVVEAAALGVPDDILGQAVVVVAAVEPGSGVAAAEIRVRCRAELEDFKQPRTVLVRDRLPHTDNGKIDRLALAAEMASEASGAGADRQG